MLKNSRMVSLESDYSCAVGGYVSLPSVDGMDLAVHKDIGCASGEEGDLAVAFVLYKKDFPPCRASSVSLSSLLLRSRSE